MQRQR